MANVKFYVGLDVHKVFTAYAVRAAEGAVVLEGRCASTPKDVEAVIAPYVTSCMVGLESNTEVYPLYDTFTTQGVDVRVANTVRMRSLVAKNDEQDARRLSDMLRLGSFPEAHIPNQTIRELRGLVSIRHRLLQESVRLQNRAKALIRRHGIRLPTRALTSKSAATLRTHLTKEDEARVLQLVLEQLENTNQQLEAVTSEASSFAKKHYPSEFDKLTSKQGLGPIIATYLLSEIQPITRFANEKKLRRYAGVIPITSESGGKTYKKHLPKTSSRPLLRWALVEASHCMSRHNERIKAYYKRKKKQKKLTGKAIMATASTISDLIYKTLTTA